MFYNARWYDSYLGRFIQADTIIPDVGNPVAWDRYAYTLNNPLKFIDPSGHYACGDGIDDPRCEQNYPSGPKNSWPMTGSAWFQQFTPSVSQPQKEQTPASNSYSFLANRQPYIPLGNFIDDSTAQRQHPQGSLEQAEVGKDILLAGFDLLEVTNGVKIPFISFVSDFVFEMADSADYPTGNRLARSLIVAGEGQLISGLAVGAGGAVFAVTPPLGVAFYLSISVTGTKGAEILNESILFPIIDATTGTKKTKN